MRAGFVRRGLPALLCLGATGFGAPSLALDLVLPGRAVQTHQESRTGDRLAVPLDRWETDHIPTQYIEGTIDLQSWRITGGGTSTLQALDALARQLVNDPRELMPVSDRQGAVIGVLERKAALDVLLGAE
ncbi:hypothetical protein [Roseovarius sp.]|uniref:hypothetical protein n=1 Tax=Roseovarius sp. TaxID=1486281 RepID=UPI00257B8E25|nr:hypothetical protein [Roseovarius sp.]